MTEEPSSSSASNPGADAGQSLWQACLEQLAQDLPEQQFNTWIKPLVAQVAEDFSKVTLFVANRFKLDWIRAQYAKRISLLLEDLYGQPVTLELALAQREAVTRTYVRPNASGTQTPVSHNDQQGQGQGSSHNNSAGNGNSASSPPDESAGAFRNRLNAGLTFELEAGL